VAERKSVSMYHYKQNTESVRRTTASSAEGDADEVAKASGTRRKQKEPDAITVEKGQKNKASCDTSTDNNTEREDERIKDEGDASSAKTTKTS